MRQGAPHHAAHGGRCGSRDVQLTRDRAGHKRSLLLPIATGDQEHQRSYPMPSDVILSVASVEAVYDHSILALRGVTLDVRQRRDPGAARGQRGRQVHHPEGRVSNLLPAERGKIRAGSIRFDGLRRGCAPAPRAWCAWASSRCSKAAIASGQSQRRGEPRHGRARARIGPRRDLRQRPRQASTRPSRVLKDKRIQPPPASSSGGEQQMTAIGRALMSRPQASSCSTSRRWASRR